MKSLMNKIIESVSANAERKYRTARISAKATIPVGYKAGQEVSIRWCGQDRRAQDLYVISSTSQFTGHSQTICARMLENFSTQE
jgi:hypothetical protein